MIDQPEDNLREPSISPAEEPAPAASAGGESVAGDPPASPSPSAEIAASPAGSAFPDSGFMPAAGQPAPFQSRVQPPVRPPARIPHFGHFAFLSLVLLPLGLAVAIILMLIALHLHLFGVSTLQGTMTNIHYLLGSEAILYLATFAFCLAIFPLFWHKNLFAGLQWNGATALRLGWRLGGAAFACFLLAMLNEVLMPGPTNAPIEKIFRTPGAAWLLFGFGVTFAPFFEETFFRGFLLPSFCTAYDWFAEALSLHKDPAWPLQGRPRWPLAARLITATVMTIPIAAICAFPRSGHYLMRVLIVGIWGLALALGWAIGHSESQGNPPRFATVDANGHPVWSFSAMAVGSILVSISFALLHAQQTGYSIGPFLLLVGVSLVLCTVRLATRSLASSVVVHACYNFLLFSLMLAGTGGFRHMDKM